MAHNTHQQADIELIGGPEDWHGQTLQLPLDPDTPRDDLGAMLITECPPPREDDEDPDPRAHYSPDPDPAPADLWWFRGWMPTSTHRAEWSRPLPADRAPASVTTDPRGIPKGWLNDGEATPCWILRIWVHWIYDGEATHGTDLSVWQVTARTAKGATVHTVHTEITHDPGTGDWATAPIPRH